VEGQTRRGRGFPSREPCRTTSTRKRVLHACGLPGHPSRGGAPRRTTAPRTSMEQAAQRKMKEKPKGNTAVGAQLALACCRKTVLLRFAARAVAIMCDHLRHCSHFQKKQSLGPELPYGWGCGPRAVSQIEEVTLLHRRCNAIEILALTTACQQIHYKPAIVCFSTGPFWIPSMCPASANSGSRRPHEPGHIRDERWKRASTV